MESYLKLEIANLGRINLDIQKKIDEINHREFMKKSTSFDSTNQESKVPSERMGKNKAMYEWEINQLKSEISEKTKEIT